MSKEPAGSAGGAGCILTLAGLNLTLTDLVASDFAPGPYSSRGQELGYRYGSLGFVLFGAVLPIVALMTVARRSETAMLMLMAWMFACLFAFGAYALAAGGGV